MEKIQTKKLHKKNLKQFLDETAENFPGSKQSRTKNKSHLKVTQ